MTVFVQTSMYLGGRLWTCEVLMLELEVSLLYCFMYPSHSLFLSVGVPVYGAVEHIDLCPDAILQGAFIGANRVHLVRLLSTCPPLPVWNAPRAVTLWRLAGLWICSVTHRCALV